MKIVEIAIPDFGAPETIPTIPAEIYAARLAKVRERMRAAGLDALLVYSDREHSANISYCSGFDPRFEEALLILTADGKNTLCVGNECLGIISTLPIKAEILLCQEFSLMGQDRSISWDLKPLLAKAGLRAGMKCGIAGWKTLMESRIEVPNYIVELTAEACGSRPVNANDIFMSSKDGLRIQNEPEQIALYEYAATRTSQSIFNVLRALAPGKRCFELARNFDGGGLPLSAHPMLAVGKVIPNGMASPGNDTIKKGEYLTTAFGVWGSLSCRAGLMVDDPKAFDAAEFAPAKALIENYLAVTRAWYATLKVGASAGDVWKAADDTRDDSQYTFCVNPGHYIHLDEWPCSPFQKGAIMRIPSSAALQADIIPVARSGGIAVNMEDGVVLADASLRAELERKFPDMYSRCQARRKFMIDALGYELSEDVLPMGNFPGAYFPCLLNTALVCCYK